jgi:hypothetical protein
MKNGKNFHTRSMEVFLSKEVNVCEKYFVILQIDNMRRREDEQCEQII